MQVAPTGQVTTPAWLMRTIEVPIPLLMVMVPKLRSLIRLSSNGLLILTVTAAVTVAADAGAAADSAARQAAIRNKRRTIDFKRSTKRAFGTSVRQYGDKVSNRLTIRAAFFGGPTKKGPPSPATPPEFLDGCPLTGR